MLPQSRDEEGTLRVPPVGIASIPLKREPPVKHTSALAALVVAAVSLSSLPVAAQDLTPAANRGDREIHRMHDGSGPGMGRGAGGILGLVCSERGAEALEIAFVRMDHRLELTDTQQPLFDTLKSKALTTQTSFADDCAAARPERTADERPDLLEGFKARLKIEEARVAALTAVLPDFEAFYASLTDQQKADLMPRMGRGDRDDAPGRDGPGRHMRLPAPGR
jgi:hypothetical protein